MASIGQRELESCMRALGRESGEAWEIYYEEERELSLEVQDGEVHAFEAASSSGAGIRVLAQGRAGFAYTCDFSADAIARTVAAARAAAAACDPDPLLSLPRAAEIGALPAVALSDTRLAEIPVADKIALARVLEQAARQSFREVARVRKASYGEASGRARLLSSEGVDLEDAATVVHCDVLVVAAAEDDEQVGWEAEFGHFLFELDFARCGKVAARRAVDLLAPMPLATGSYAAVLEPHVVCELIEALGDSLSGESVAKGRSLLAGKLGQAVASPLFTLRDDATDPRGAASSRFDGEGMPRRATVVIEGGRLAGFLYDRYWAAKTGARSTGNSERAGFRAPPALGTSNLIVASGASGDASALCQTMGDGILIRELSGVHMIDPVSGEFSLGATGRRVHRGHLAEAFAGVAVAGNLLDLLRSVCAVGSDIRFYGSVGAPSLLCQPVAIAGE
jgi:PmbA protein